MNWLPLTDYSTKYKVSVSTLRRRIKTDEIRFRFEDGKYLISDEPMETHARVHRPSPQMHAPASGSPEVETTAAAVNSGDEPVLTAANHLLAELKRAYTLILQEKEEQILQLKEEVADLKTLVRVLESENSRLKSF